MAAVQQTIDQVKSIDVDKYKYGFETDIETVLAPKGLDESTVRYISEKKNEPGWMLEWRLDAFRRWKTMEEPTWAKVTYPKIDFQDLHYYAAPRSTEGPKDLSEVDPELLQDVRKTRHSAEGAGVACGRDGLASCGRRGFRQRFGGDDLQGGAQESGRDLLFDLGGAA